MAADSRVASRRTLAGAALSLATLGVFALTPTLVQAGADRKHCERTRSIVKETQSCRPTHESGGMSYGARTGY
jgi:hypothetical protein